MRMILIFCALAAAGLCGCADVNSAPPQTPTQMSQAQSFGDYLAARLAASDHDMADAAKLYNESLAGDPGNADILGHAFLFSAEAGDVGKAAALAGELLKSDPDNRAARLALAVAEMREGDYAGARAHMAAPGKDVFNGLTFLLLDAWAAAGLHDVKSAEADLSRVVAQGGTQTLADFHRALIEDLAGNTEAAETAYKSADSTGGESPRIADAYGRFLERQGRTAEARQFYEKVKNDTALAPLAAQGLQRIAAGQKPGPLIASPAAGAAEALFGIAASLTDENSADVAVLYLRFALYLAPDLDLAKIVLADRFEILGKYTDAIAAYTSLDADSPYRTAARVQIALDETRLGHNDKAVAELQALAQADPKDVTTWTALGDAYRDQSKFPQAADAYDRAVALLGTDRASAWPLYYARAIAEERSHHWDAAEGDLKHALQISPDQPQVLNYLGYSWVDQGRHLPDALAMLEKARSLSPFDGYIVDSVGWAYYRLGRYKDAVQTLENAILLVPGDPTVNEHLGDAYWKVGRKLEARFQWSHALAFGPDPAQKTELEKKLATGVAAK